MYKRPLFSLNNPFIILFFIFSFGIIIGCSDSLDKSPVSSIPNSQIPDDIAPVSSPTNSLQIKGGAIEKNKVILYLRFETNKDKTPVSSLSNSLQIKGGSIGRNSATLYIRLEKVKYKDSEVWFRLISSDSSYTFEEILNREPNNFINDITYEYFVNNLSSNTDYNVWIVWKDGLETEEVGTHFTTLSK